MFKNKKGLVGVLGLLFWMGVVACFGVAEATVTVSLPEVTAEAGATGVEVPVNVSEAEGIGGFSFIVTFNPDIIQTTPATVGELTLGWVVISSIDNTAGTVEVGAFHPALAVLPAGRGSI